MIYGPGPIPAERAFLRGPVGRKFGKVGAFVAKIIATVNQKGGVGKTTTCVNLAATLTEAGKKVLLCDFDPQANATSGMGVDKTVSKGVYSALIGELPAAEVVAHTRYGDVLPSNKALAGAGVELIGMENREFLLRDALSSLRESYDFILIDCPPSLELQVADEVKHYFPGKVYGAVIPRNIRLSEAPSHGKPITAYDRASRGADAYTAFATEFLTASPKN